MFMPSFLKAAGCAGLVAMIAGCGFTPLYADRSANLVGNLSQIEVARIESTSEAGFILESELQKTLGTGASSYVLEVELDETIRSQAITRQADTVLYDYVLTADYQLFDTATESLIEDRKQAIISYGAAPSQFATQVAKEDAIRRAAEQIADEIELDLVLYFNGLGSADK